MLTDDLYLPFFQHIREMMPVEDCIVIDEEKGILTYPEKVEISTPLEMEIVANDDGEIQVGSAPPMYYANTSLLPVFHHLRITIVKNE